MILLGHLRSAVRTLRANLLRSALTMLGIIIGVAAVIAVLAVGAGSQQIVLDELRNIGANLLMVSPGSAKSSGARLGGGTQTSLTLGDANAIRTEVPGLVSVAPMLYSRAQVVHGNANWSTRIQGVTPDIFTAREWRLSAGRSFSPGELLGSGKVALLGATVVEQLFDSRNPLGQVIRVVNTPFRVVGVLAPKGQTASASDQDDRVMIPFSSARSRIQGQFAGRLDAVDYIMIKVAHSEHMASAILDITGLLRQRHQLMAGVVNDFEVKNLAEMREKKEKASGVLGFWLATVASVSLLVGGISIMNIMLVAVTERTREIGLRLAVGARPQDIQLQFLIEALLLSLLGALVGVCLGLGAALLIGAFGEVPVVIQPSAILLAAGFAAATGILFGFYPAYRASHMDPISALRFE
jgi:putative ABC transport system permease protein